MLTNGSQLVSVLKLQINLVVEDALVSLDDLQATVEEDEDHVQSTDIAAMQNCKFLHFYFVDLLITVNIFLSIIICSATELYSMCVFS